MGPEGGKRWGEFRESRLQVLYTSGCERDYRLIIQCTHDPLVRKDHHLFTEPPRTLQKIKRTTAGKNGTTAETTQCLMGVLATKVPGSTQSPISCHTHVCASLTSKTVSEFDLCDCTPLVRFLLATVGMAWW